MPRTKLADGAVKGRIWAKPDQVLLAGDLGKSAREWLIYPECGGLVTYDEPVNRDHTPSAERPSSAAAGAPATWWFDVTPSALAVRWSVLLSFRIGVDG